MGLRKALYYIIIIAYLCQSFLYVYWIHRQHKRIEILEIRSYGEDYFKHTKEIFTDIRDLPEDLRKMSR